MSTKIEKEYDEYLIRQKPRLARTRTRITKPRIFSKLNEVLYPIPEAQFLGSQYIDYAHEFRGNHVWKCEDTIINPKYTGPRPVDDGGIFRNTYIYNKEHGHVPFQILRYNGRKWGHLYALAYANEFFHGIFPSVSEVSPPQDLSASEYHQTAWKAMLPLRPVVDLAEEIAEIKDVFNLFTFKIENIYKSSGDLYLLSKFGWEPIFRLIKKLLSLTENLERKYKYILSNLGKPVRQRWELPETVETEILIERPGTPAVPELLWIYENGSESRQHLWNSLLRCKTTTKVWATGNYVFAFDKSITPLKSREIKSRLLGLQISASTFWEVLRYSWLVDYFVNVGGMIDTLTLPTSVADSQFSLYAYIMKHTRRVYTWESYDGFRTPSCQRIYDTKIREPINPYGLSVNSSLTPSQEAIIAAFVSQRL